MNDFIAEMMDFNPLILPCLRVVHIFVHTNGKSIPFVFEQVVLAPDSPVPNHDLTEAKTNTAVQGAEALA
jgi:hypothetical protein